MTLAVPPVVVLAIGNPSRGDDALGPTLAAHLAEWVKGKQLERWVEIVEDFQLQIEHALDIVGRHYVLFVDADIGAAAPFALRQIVAHSDTRHTTHALSPEAVLSVFELTESRSAPPSFVMGIRGERFELGESLSENAEKHLTQAFETAVEQLSDWIRSIADPDVGDIRVC